MLFENYVNKYNNVKYLQTLNYGELTEPVH